jgi:RHS repeat-associated protein
MKTQYIKYLGLILFIHFFFVSGFVYSQQRSYTLDSKASNIATVYEARDYILFKPGYSFTPQNGVGLEAKINPNILFNVDYTGTTNLPKPAEYTIDKTLPFGSIAGTFNVSQTGGANYIVPISCPPGIGQMVPQISVSYNSQGGNGMLGMGFSITGLSAITRVPKDFYHEGNYTPITFDSNDRFSLDGNRLICTDDSYGSNTSLYRTENETFSIIKMHKQTNTYDPDSFEVCTKNGVKMKYGSATGKQIYTSGDKTTGVAWYLDYQEDPFGNYVKYRYEQRGLILYIKTIIYGSNKNVSGTVTDSINFYYETRSDPIPTVIGKQKGTIDLILNRIRSYTNQFLYREYNFEYGFDVYSRLVKITENNGAGEKLNPTVFRWEPINKTPVSTYTVDVPTKYNTNNKYISGDINADGRDEIIEIYDITKYNITSTYAKVYYSNPSVNGNITFEKGDSILLNVNMPESYCVNFLHSTFFIEDVDGDHINELIVDNRMGTYIKANFVKKTNNYYSYAQVCSAEERLTGFIDRLGDGKRDLIGVSKTKDIYGKFQGVIATDNGVSTTTTQTMIYFTHMSNPKKMLIADLNGDGMHDVIFAASKYIYIYKGYASTPSDSILTNCSDYDIFKSGDFNGDGLVDFVYNKRESLEWYILLNRGNYVFETKLLSNITVGNENYTGKDENTHNCIVSDFNNDGKSDLLVFDADYAYHDPLLGPNYGTFKYFKTFWYHSNGEDFSLDKQMVSGNESDAQAWYYISGDYNGDGRQDLINYGYNCLAATADSSTQKWRIYTTYNPSLSEGLITNISDGLGYKNAITYSNLSKLYNYSYSALTNQYPLDKVAAPLYVVKDISSNNGIYVNATNSYSYKNATVHTYYGFMGFEQISSTNWLTNTTIENNYKFVMDNDGTSKYLPYLTSNITRIETDTLQKTNNIKYTINNYKDKGYYFYQTSALTTDYSEKKKTESNTYMSQDGNLTESYNKTYDWDNNLIASAYVGYNDYVDRVSDLNSFTNYPNSMVVENNYTDDTPNYFESLTTFTYNSNGTLKTETKSAETEKRVTTAYSYDSFGNNTNTTLSCSEEKSRTSSSTYEPSGRFVISQKNALNHTSKASFDIWGNTLSNADINGRNNYYTYDNWGRCTQSIDADFNKQISLVNWVNGQSEAPYGALYYTETWFENEKVTNSKVRTSAEYFDTLGRSLRKVGYSQNGTLLYTDFVYDAKGRNTSQTIPYPAGGSDPLKTLYSYDSRSRVATLTSPTQVVTTFNYFDSEKKKKIQQSQSTGEYSIKTYDAAGLLTEASDAGGTIKYYYTPTGKPHRIEAPGSTTLIHYNYYGLQDTLYDPNAGKIAYEYNAYGELTKQIDAKENVTTKNYDVLGRDSVIVSNGITTQYTYDAPYAKGKIKSISSTGKAPSEFGYNRSGRLISEKRGQGASQFIYKYGYDIQGRLDTVKYPAGFTLTYTYNNYDDITAIYNQANLSTPIWKLGAVNTKGQISGATYGNSLKMTYGYDNNNCLNSITVPNILNFNYTYNSQGQLINRTEFGVPESFVYDAVNRLKTINSGGGDVQLLNMEYSNTASPQNDRIVNKSDIGTYVYKSATNHQLDKVELTKGLYLPKHELTYTAEQKTATLKQTGADGTLKLDTFTYGVDDQRFSMEYKRNGALQYTRYYFNNYEKEVDANGTLKRHLNYIYAPTGLVAIYEQTPTEAKMHYIYTDYLGSLKCITNEEGSVEQYLSYDAWGKRRNPLTGAPFLSVPTNLLFARGYTGHEHLDEFELINMNGRIYDPSLALFLSPDNYVQASDFSQNFNRYGYCLNNPLMYTDPSGNKFKWWSFIPVYGPLSKITSSDQFYDFQKYVSPIAFRTDFDFGTHQNGFGIDVSIGIPQAALISYRFEVGATYFSDRIGGYGSGWQTRVGGEWSLGSGRIKYGGLQYRDFDSDGHLVADQVVHTATIGLPGMNIDYSNDTKGSFPWADAVPFIPVLRDGIPGLDGSDRYRTTSGRIRVGLMELGFFLHTGEGDNYEQRDINGNGVLEMLGGNIDDPNRSNGIIYLGFGSLKIGADYEDIRNSLQNVLVHDKLNGGKNGSKYPWVYPIWSRKPRFVFQFGSF